MFRVFLYHILYILVSISWLPHCQEKSGKTKKNDKSPEKSGENGGFRKKVMKSQEI